MLKKTFYDHPLVHVVFVYTEQTFLASGDTNGNWGIVNSQENDYTGFGFADEE